MGQFNINKTNLFPCMSTLGMELDTNRAKCSNGTSGYKMVAREGWHCIYKRLPLLLTSWHTRKCWSFSPKKV